MFWTNLVTIHEHVQLSDTYAKIRLIELVRNVPSQRAELSTFLNQTMEETKTEQHLLELLLKKRKEEILEKSKP